MTDNINDDTERAIAAADPGLFIGSWRLLSIDYLLDDGSLADTGWGESPLALIIYDANGNVAHQLSRSDRARWGTDDRLGGTDQQVRAALESYIAYFGTYSIDWQERSVTHSIRACTFPDWVGTGQKRFFSFEDGRLALRTAPYPLAGQNVVASLLWERA